MAGLKYVENNLADFADCLNLKSPTFGKYDIFWADNPKIRSLAFNATAFTLAESYTGPYLLDIVTKYYANDMAGANAAQQRLTDLYSIGGGKDILSMIGITMGPPRLPNVPMSQANYDRIYSSLKAFGFINLFDYGHCLITGTTSNPPVTGAIKLSSYSGGIQVQVFLKGLVQQANSEIGIHIHEFGDLTSGDGNLLVLITLVLGPPTTAVQTTQIAMKEIWVIGMLILKAPSIKLNC
jgi:hypothetical protein